MLNINKSLDKFNIGDFFFTLFVLWVGSFSFIMFSSFCENSQNHSDCNYIEILVAFFAPIIINFVIYAIIQSSRYRKFEEGKIINRITGYLEIVAAPFFAGFHFFIYYIVLGFQNQSTSILRESFPYFSIIIFLALLIDGIRRLKTKTIIETTPNQVNTPTL